MPASLSCCLRFKNTQQETILQLLLDLKRAPWCASNQIGPGTDKTIFAVDVQIDLRVLKFFHCYPYHLACRELPECLPVHLDPQTSFQMGIHLHGDLHEPVCVRLAPAARSQCLSRLRWFPNSIA